MNVHLLSTVCRLQDKHFPEGLKVHLGLVRVEKVSEKDCKGPRASQDPQDHQDHRARLAYLARDYQECQGSQGLLVPGVIQGSENLACQGCRENLEDLDYQGRRATSVQVEGKGQQAFLGLQVSPVPLVYLGFPNQVVRGFLD